MPHRLPGPLFACIRLFVSEAAGGCALRGNSRSKATANRSQQIQSCLKGNLVDLQHRLGLPLTSRQLSLQVQPPVADSRIAAQIVQCVLRVLIEKVAVGIEIQRCVGRKLLATDPDDAQSRLGLSAVCCSHHGDIGGHVAAPSGIRSIQQTGELAKLGLAPLHLQLQRHRAKLGGAVQAGLHSDFSGIRRAHFHIRAHWLAAQPHPPRSRRILPERKIRADQRKRSLLQTLLQVHARIGRFKIWKMNCGSRGSFVLPSHSRGIPTGQRRLGPHQQRTQVPASIRGLHQVQTGFIHADAVDLQPSPPQGRNANGSNYGPRKENGLRSKARVFADREIVQHKAWPRQQAQLHTGHVHRPPHRTGHQSRNPALITPDVDQRRKHDRGRDQHNQDADQRDPPIPAGLPRSLFVGVGIDGTGR